MGLMKQIEKTEGKYMTNTGCRLSLLLIGSMVAMAQGTNANAVTFNRVLGGKTHDYANAVQQTSDGSSRRGRSYALSAIYRKSIGNASATGQRTRK